MSLLTELRSSQNLKLWADLRRGSLLDWSGNGNHCTAVTGSPRWRQTSCGLGIESYQATQNGISTGNPASLQLSTVTLACVAVSSGRNMIGATGTYQTLLAKTNAYDMLLQKTTATFGVYDYTAAAFRSSGVAAKPGTPHLFAASMTSGAANGLLMYVDGAWRATSQMTVVNQASNVNVLFNNAGQDLEGVGLWFAIVNRVLTGDEHARLYEEWLSESYVRDLPRKGFSFPSNTLSDPQATALGIALDTRFQRGADNKVVDCGPVGYPGTITGGQISWLEDGLRQNSATSAVGYVNFGNVTQLNSAQKAIVECVCRNTDTSAVRMVWEKWVGATSWFALEQSAANPAIPTVRCANGSNTYGAPASGFMRQGQPQHVLVAFDGTGASDAARLRLFVDGDKYTLTITNPPVPATLANLAAGVLRTTGAGTTVASGVLGEYSFLRTVAGQSWTDAQCRRAYVKNFGQKFLARETFEDVPVTLPASVGAGCKLGNFEVISGTWKCSQSTDGKKWLECVTAGCVVREQPYTFGTVQFQLQKVLDAGAVAVMFQASAPLAYGSATCNGYAVVLDANEAVIVARRAGAGAPTVLTQSGNGYVALSTTYVLTANRRPSDGRFTSYIKGGAYASHTLVSAGGGGANPTAAESTYTTSSWLSVSLNAGDKLLMYDPYDPRVGIWWWQGVLDPSAGETY